jgi:hypothetical protein
LSGERFGEKQVTRKNYSNALLFIVSCLLTETSPNPTTEVAEKGFRLDLASIRMLARSLNILSSILLEKKNESMIFRNQFRRVPKRVIHET